VKRILYVVLPYVVVATALGLGARGAAAQVGYPPARSPFLDVDQTHEITPIFGYLRAKRDPARVAPQGGLLLGLQYEWRATGPLHVGVDLLAVNSTRTPLDPTRPPASRSLGNTSQPLYAVDAFASASLNGPRSWHHLMPMVTAGLGVITDGHTADVGGFKFGTRFTLPWGAGVRWVPGSGRLQLRADVRDWMYTIVYPPSYHISNTLDAPILNTNVAPSRWTNNFAMTLGVTYSFSH